MELIDENVAMLSNFEVLDLLSKAKQETKGRRPNSHSQNLATITYETLDYLSHTPCSYQDPNIIETFLAALKPYKLTKAEKLQLLNLRPTTAVEIQLMIAESEERFTDEEVTALLDTVDSILPNPSSGEEAMETAQTSGVSGSRESDCAAKSLSDAPINPEQ